MYAYCTVQAIAQDSSGQAKACSTRLVTCSTKFLNIYVVGRSSRPYQQVLAERMDTI
jgi:hypothetical protein